MSRHGFRRDAESVGIVVVGIIAGFVLFLVQAPHGLWSGSRRQLTRPLQVESLAASFWAVAHQFGLRVQSVKSYGSDNLTTHGSELLRISPTTGSVLQTVNMPPIDRPLIATNADGFWLAPATNSSGHGLYHLGPGMTRPAFVWPRSPWTLIPTPTSSSRS